MENYTKLIKKGFYLQEIKTFGVEGYSEYTCEGVFTKDGYSYTMLFEGWKA